jgi:hypothetical protein
MGDRVTRLFDVGVAGIHRLLAVRGELADANVIIAVAGMEGALPSLVAGLVKVPVIAVPTSVGYGAHFGGVAPLLTMLNSCAPGIGVVNIDNGYGAAALASRINRAAVGGLSVAADGAGPRSEQLRAPGETEGLGRSASPVRGAGPAPADAPEAD